MDILKLRLPDYMIFVVDKRRSYEGKYVYSQREFDSFEKLLKYYLAHREICFEVLIKGKRYHWDELLETLESFIEENVKTHAKHTETHACVSETHDSDLISKTEDMKEQL